MFCHRILRTIQTCAEKSTVINSDLWDCMLRFLLSVNDVLLAPPAEKGNSQMFMIALKLSILSLLLQNSSEIIVMKIVVKGR